MSLDGLICDILLNLGNLRATKIILYSLRFNLCSTTQLYKLSTKITLLNKLGFYLEDAFEVFTEE